MTTFIRVLNVLLTVGMVISLARGDYQTAVLLFIGLAVVVITAGLRLPGTKD